MTLEARGAKVREWQGESLGPARRILLTGGTGFLGAHLLMELMQRTSAHVTCLARGATDEAARAALERRIAWYFPEVAPAEYAGRLSVKAGDVGQPRLGLDTESYELVAASHGKILNSAANVSQVGAAAQFFRINTDGVASLIELARHRIPKELHQVSTINVMGELRGSPSLTAFSERHLEEGQSFQSPYAESKHRAEVLARRAFDAGLGGAVYRVGFVGPHGSSGRFQQNIEQNALALYLRACTRLGFAPYLPENRQRLTPVDSIARAIVTLLGRAEFQGKTYYVQNPNVVTQYDIARVLQAAGYPLRLMRVEDFLERAPRLGRDEEAVRTLLPERGRPNTQVVPIDSSFSQAELRRLGFEYPRVSSAWLGRFLQHAIEVGFLEAPRFWSAAPLPDVLS